MVLASLDRDARDAMDVTACPPGTTVAQRGSAQPEAPRLPLLVQLAAGEVHQRIAEQFDLDAVGVLEVHRLRDALVGPEVRHPRLVEPGTQPLPPISGYRDRDVLDRADRLDAGRQAQ